MKNKSQQIKIAVSSVSMLTVILFAATTVFAWTGPTGTAPANNTASPVDTSATTQVKTGNFSANSIGATVGYCIGASCITSWPISGTSQWTTSGSNIYYNTGAVTVGSTAPGSTNDKLSVNGGNLEVYNSSSAYNTNTNGMILGTYSGYGYVQAPSASSIHIWTSGTADIAKFDSTGLTLLGSSALMDSAGTRMDAGGGWMRTYGSTGWYNNTYGGGWSMQDSTWIRSYGSKAVYMDTGFDTNAASGVACGGGLGGGFTFRVCGTEQVANVLQVNGPANDWATKSISAGPYGIYTANSSGYYDYLAYSSWALYTNGNIWAGTIYGNAYYYNSDARLKKNIQPIDNALSKVLSLEGVTYNWIDPKAGTGRELGFIAQDVEKVVPELVVTNASTTYKAVDYGRVTALLVNAVKEQNDTITQLQKQTDALTAKAAQQQAEIDQLIAASKASH